MKIFNSLTRKVEEFNPIKQGEVGVYTCGPTVYDTATIGNFRTYVLADLVVRVFRYFDYNVRHVMNITDVGHLTGDNLGDADTGEDRMEKAAKKEGKTAWSVANHYIVEFLDHMKLLNIIKPDEMPRATEHIREQIEMVERLGQKGFTYQINDGVYFDVSKYEEMGNEYGELSTLDEVMEGARVTKNPEKRGPRDFALWKFCPEGTRREMEWDSPWGMGYPGWHIECSAMSKKYLGSQFDLHIGGEDLRSTHHPNEVAQSEGVSGKKPFVKYWMHGAFLLIDGGRMGKSLGNAYTVEDVVKRGYEPMALRYFYLTSRYRKQSNFTWKILGAAATALGRMRELYSAASQGRGSRTELSAQKMEKISGYQRDFDQRLEDDFDFPGALAIVWEVLKSNVASSDKVDLVEGFDKVLGLGLNDWEPKVIKVSDEVKKLLTKRDKLRGEGKFREADKVRVEIEKKGYKIEDNGDESKVVGKV